MSDKLAREAWYYVFKYKLKNNHVRIPKPHANCKCYPLPPISEGDRL